MAEDTDRSEKFSPRSLQLMLISFAFVGIVIAGIFFISPLIDPRIRISNNFMVAITLYFVAAAVIAPVFVRNKIKKSESK